VNIINIIVLKEVSLAD